MAIYVIRRLFQGILVLLAATFLTYSIFVITPGGPQDQINELRAQGAGGRPVNERLINQILAAYKLDSPYPVNYLRWLFDPLETQELDRNDNTRYIPKGVDVNILGFQIKGSGLLTGDLGTSLQLAKGTPAMELVYARLGNTLALTVSALLISLLIALPVGIISAVKQYSKLDYTVTTFSFFGLSMPTFWLGLMLIIFAGIIAKQLNQNGWEWMPYLPTGFAYDIDQENNLVNRIYHLVLPVTVLAFVNIAQFARFVRASMLEVLRQDYVRTAWAKGSTQRSVILRHALRNALLPVITIVTLALPFLLSGAIATETIFSYPGMGQLFFAAITVVDLPVAMTFLTIVTILIITSNILADVLYAVVDPRIQYS
ncbi:MAG: ABC transporter permease [Chloroflexota bacterium]|nr:ABC transporter permease [Chloroflexota bacterium]